MIEQDFVLYSGSSIVVYIERWKNGNDNHYFAALKQVQSALISGKKWNLGESHFLNVFEKISRLRSEENKTSEKPIAFSL